VSEQLDALCRQTGIVWQFWDGAGNQREAPPESRRATLCALGFVAETDDGVADALAALNAESAARRLPEWLVVTAGQEPELNLLGDGETEWRLELEDGTVREGRSAVVLHAGSMPAGRHVLTVAGYETTLLAAPDRLPDPARAWGVTLPLYGLPPENGGGIGTYGDLARAASALGSLGASFVGVNPVHAGFPDDPENYSPYAPSNRRRLNVALVETGDEPDLGGGALIDYRPALDAKRVALANLYKAFAETGGAPDFDAFLARQGDALTRFAIHQALSDEYGPYWVDWPQSLQSPSSPDVSAFAEARADRVRFHAWLQWMAETQLDAAQSAAKSAGMRYGLYLDLAVGTHPAGAETWADASLFARDISLGAPPDAFSAEGQVWGVAPLSPRALVRNRFAVLAETLREQLRFSGILRIDHILGFERAFWCPQGLPGLYVTMPKAAMLAVLRMEVARAGAVAIGEDLGNIPDGLRHDLHTSGILGCRVAMFERHWHDGGRFKHGGEYDHQVLASFSSHDLPTWRGWRKGLDISWRARTGAMDDDVAAREQDGRRGEVAALEGVMGDDSGSPDAMHAFLSGAASQLVALQAEDILGIEEQPNLPGTIHEHPNWRRRMPIAASAFASDERFARTGEIMRNSGR
jgi:4-alpha-glucanotransferase